MVKITQLKIFIKLRLMFYIAFVENEIDVFKRLYDKTKLKSCLNGNITMGYPTDIFCLPNVPRQKLM
jgi:hypothetical protein